MMTGIKGIPFVKLKGVYVPLTFLLTWKFALKAKVYLASLMQEASSKKQGEARESNRRKVLQSAAHSLAALASFSRFHILSSLKRKKINKSKPKV